MNNTGIAAIAPQGMQQGTPSIPQEFEPKAQGGVTGGIAPDLGGLDRRTLAMAVLGQVPGVEPAAALGRLNKLVETEKMQQAMAGQRAMAQQAQQAQQPPVAQQVLMQALHSGIGAHPQQFAEGGVVGYFGGGSIGYGFADPVAAAEAMALDELRVGRQRELNQLAYPPDAQELQRLGMKYGIVLSPYASPEERTQKIKEIRGRVAAEQAMATNRAEIPVDPALIKSPPPRVRPDEALAAMPAVAPVARPTARSTTAKAAPTAPTAPTARDELADANKAYIEAISKAGTTPQDEIDARAELRKRLEEIQQTRLSRQEKLEADLAERRAAMGQRPSGFQDPEFLLRLAAGMGGTKTLGQALTGAAGAAGEYAGQRRKEGVEAEREMRREQMDLMKLREANEDLKTALYEKDLAYASGGANAKRAADLKVAEARANMANADREFKLKQYQAESGRISAEASRTAAAQRGEAASARGQLTPYQIAQIRSKAKDSITKDKNYQQRLIDASSRARKQGVVFDQEAWLNQLVDNEMQEVARAMGYGLPSTGLNPPPGADQKTYDFLKIGPK